MAVKIKTPAGMIDIANDVIATVVGGAATDNYGVVGMASRNPLKDGVNQILGRDSFHQGVVIRQQDNGIAVDVYIIVGYGTKISAVSKSVQEKVKYNLEAMLGVTAIHRIMTDMLKGTEKETMILRYTDFAERASKQSSEREVIAMQIERKAEDCYKAEYARRHLGECYEGTISGVTQRGLFIELDNGVEGFVPASSLTPSGTSLTEGVRLTDPASGKTWSLGDKMMITIVRADVNLGKIDFEVAPAAKA